MNKYSVSPFLLIFSLVALIMSCSSKEKEENAREVVEPIETPVKRFKTIQIQPVEVNGSVNISGRVIPIQKMEVVAQVQGTALRTVKSFKDGVSFKAGETLIEIDDKEFRNNLTAKKSQYVSSLVRIMSDLKIDFPNDFEKWNEYLASISIEKALPKFPDVDKPQLRYYLSTNNIYNLYYNIKSAEEVLDRYKIKAPFDGTVVESRLDEGSLVRPGIPLGEFIRTDKYEIRASVSITDVSKAVIGQKMTFTSPDTGGQWIGSVVRIGKRVESSTQAVTIYLLVKGAELKEGMYLEGVLRTDSFKNATELSRDVITRSNQVYVIKDDRVQLKNIEPLSFNGDIVVVSGLEVGDLVIVDEVNSSIQGIAAKAK